MRTVSESRSLKETTFVWRCHSQPTPSDTRSNSRKEVPVMNSRFIVRLVLSVGMLAGIGAVSGDAGACGDEVAPAIDHRIMGVARAEKDLRDGKYLAAAGSVLRMMPHVRTSKPGKDPLFARGLRTLAVAVARADGALPLEKEVPDFVLAQWAG